MSDEALKTDMHTMTDVELRDAVGQLLQREAERLQQEEERRLQLDHQKKEQAEAAISRMAKSIEAIKWGVLSICSVMAISLFIGIAVLMELEREAERIKMEVSAIEREAEKMVDKLRHPFQSLGASLGRSIESSIGLIDPADDNQ